MICPVCLSSDGWFTTTCCGHNFHTECIKNQKKCPMCRHVLNQSYYIDKTGTIHCYEYGYCRLINILTRK